MSWTCECGAFTDSPDTRALPHMKRCPIFDGKPVSVTLDPPTMPEGLELARVRKQLALASQALRDIQKHSGYGNWAERIATRTIEAIEKAGRE